MNYQSLPSNKYNEIIELHKGISDIIEKCELDGTYWDNKNDNEEYQKDREKYDELVHQYWLIHDEYKLSNDEGLSPFNCVLNTSTIHRVMIESLKRVHIYKHISYKDVLDSVDKPYDEKILLLGKYLESSCEDVHRKLEYTPSGKTYKSSYDNGVRIGEKWEKNSILEILLVIFEDELSGDHRKTQKHEESEVQ
jgi:hypothetical protein